MSFFNSLIEKNSNYVHLGFTSVQVLFYWYSDNSVFLEMFIQYYSMIDLIFILLLLLLLMYIKKIVYIKMVHKKVKYNVFLQIENKMIILCSSLFQTWLVSYPVFPFFFTVGTLISGMNLFHLSSDRSVNYILFPNVQSGVELYGNR